MTDLTERPAVAIDWVASTDHRWVGRRAGEPVAVVEQGRRFTVSDAGGRRVGVYESLQGAQQAAALLDADLDELPESRSWEGLVLVAMVAGAALLLLGVYALITL